MDQTLRASRQIVNDYLQFFVNRRAYTMQSMRPHPESGRHYYFRPTKKGKAARIELTTETIRRHKHGSYGITPERFHSTNSRPRRIKQRSGYLSYDARPSFVTAE